MAHIVLVPPRDKGPVVVCSVGCGHTGKASPEIRETHGLWSEKRFDYVFWILKFIEIIWTPIGPLLDSGLYWEGGGVGRKLLRAPEGVRTLNGAVYCVLGLTMLNQTYILRDSWDGCGDARNPTATGNEWSLPSFPISKRQTVGSSLLRSVSQSSAKEVHNSFPYGDSKRTDQSHRSG